MRAAVYAGFGGPDDIEIRDVPAPDPDPTEALVEVGAAAVNHHDLWLLRGEAGLDGDDLPFVSGVDVAGTVTAVGAAVSDLSVGDRVVLCPNETCGTCRHCREGPENRCADYGLFHGGFAEQFAAPADRLIPVPDGVSLATAAAVPVSYLTA
ncbi:MAG: alcohol dehydrogenase catalytic domain-containing protein, partial [Halobacteriales archaeon]|nr:alcohol dehydrogenase catalytic domain-containing protein [Halobacteriales archaeon]